MALFQKSISPIPPMPPGCIGAPFFSGLSATIASVVTSRPATEAACCSADRTTLVGSAARSSPARRTSHAGVTAADAMADASQARPHPVWPDFFLL